MNRVAGAAVVAAVLLALTGCGPYALAFSPTAGLPETEDFAGTWIHSPENAFLGHEDSSSGASIVLSADGTFSLTGVPREALGREDAEFEHSVELMDATGRWALPDYGPASMEFLALSDLTDSGVSTHLYYYDPPFSGPIFFFSPGTVDDGHWYRFTRATE